MALQLPTRVFSTLVQSIIASIQGATTALLDASEGSITLAIADATSSVLLWIQSLLTTLLKFIRASTCEGAALDSWLADFGFARLPGTMATGSAVFSRFTYTQSSLVQVGVSVQSADGTLIYTVIADPTNAAYVSAQNGYPLAAGQQSVSATVQAVAIGTSYNAQAGQINTLGSPMPGVDTVSNPNAFTNGSNAESDDAVRARFTMWIASLTKGTKAAVAYAITQVLETADYQIVENQTYSGGAMPGYFYVVVDDGSGNPPTSFLNAMIAAIDAVRPVSVTFNVFGPLLIQASYTAALTVAPGFDPVATKAAAVTAVTAYINSLSLGQSLPFSRLAQVAYDASPGIINVTAAGLNGGTADLACAPSQVIRPASIVFP